MATCWAAIGQILGAAGIVETFVEISYAIINYADFTPFERKLFFVSGIAETIGEVIFVGYMIESVLKKDIRRSASDACTAATNFTRDPLHVYGFSPWGRRNNMPQNEPGFDKELNGSAAFGLVLAFFPSLCWWAIFPFAVFTDGFKSAGDYSVMLALSITSFCMFIVFSVKVMFDVEVFHVFATYPTLACLYSVQKVFEVYLLLARHDRLANTELGEALLVLQLVEILSCALVVGKYVIVQRNTSVNSSATAAMVAREGTRTSGV